MTPPAGARTTGRWRGMALAALFCALSSLPAGRADAETWRFTLIGDTPYSGYERREFPAMLDAIAEESPELIVHVGDFKASKAPCTDALFAERHALFDAARVPFVFVPGDNEWTDCKRLPAGYYDESERLAALRRLFFAAPVSLGQRKIELEQQSAEFPEHLRWRLGPVLMLTLNVPGPNNNFGLTPRPSIEFRERNPNVVAWLREGFALARREGRAGVVVFMQANPGFKHFAAGLARRGYRELLETLREETQRFPGQVLLAHGDTHWQRTDRPLRAADGRILENFTRTESFGYPFMGWTRIVIDDRDPALFRFQTQVWPPR